MHLTFESPEFLKLHYCFQIALAPRKPGRSKPQIILHHRLPVQLPVLSLKKKKNYLNIKRQDSIENQQK